MGNISKDLSSYFLSLLNQREAKSSISLRIKRQLQDFYQLKIQHWFLGKEEKAQMENNQEIIEKIQDFNIHLLFLNLSIIRVMFCQMNMSSSNFVMLG